MTGLHVTTGDLSVSYGSTPALSGVDLDLSQDRIHGLLGRNGAGKTTLLSALASLRRPSAGQVALDGADPFENEALMEQVCLIRESGDLLGDERVRANLDFQELARPSFDRDYAERLLDQFEVPLRSKPQTLSRGKQSALGVVVGIASRAPLTMLDEVHLGMDAPSRHLFYSELLEDFVAHPRTVILSSHLISEVEHLLDTVTVLDRGRLLLSQESEQLRSQGLSITGRADRVAGATRDVRVIGVRDLGPTRQVTVFGPADPQWVAELEQHGLTVGAVPLQDLFVHLTDPTTDLGPVPKGGPSASHRPLADKDAR